MANTALDWELRKIMCDLRDGGRLSVLLCYVLHANERNRAWPSVDLLVKETGWSRSVVVKAKDWLTEHKALETVPLDKRLGKEAALHHRREVLQLTGTIELEGKTYPYLHYNKETNDSISSVGELNGVNSSLSKRIVTKRIVSEPEGITIVVPKILPPDEVGAATERPNAYAVYESNIGPLTPLIADSIEDAVKEFSEGWFSDAVAIAVLHNARNMAYILAILNRWKVEGKDNGTKATPPKLVEYPELPDAPARIAK